MFRVSSCPIVVLVLLATVLATSVEAGVLDPDVMKAALHTATPQENGFIEAIVAKVDKGTLPLELVQSTFLWARKRPRKKFYYFKQALILRAAARGIQL
jgi:hypothetical protein